MPSVMSSVLDGFIVVLPARRILASRSDAVLVRFRLAPTVRDHTGLSSRAGRRVATVHQLDRVAL